MRNEDFTWTRSLSAPNLLGFPRIQYEKNTKKQQQMKFCERWDHCMFMLHWELLLTASFTRWHTISRGCMRKKLDATSGREGTSHCPYAKMFKGTSGSSRRIFTGKDFRRNVSGVWAYSWMGLKQRNGAGPKTYDGPPYLSGCVKTSRLGDHKRVHIDLILTRLWSPNRGSFHANRSVKNFWKIALVHRFIKIVTHF